MIGFGAIVKNVVTICCQSATGQEQQPSVVNVKMNQDQPHPRAFLKCESVFFVMNGMQQVYSSKNHSALKRAES